MSGGFRDLSERLTELFVLSAALYFEDAPRPGAPPTSRQRALHETASLLMALTPATVRGEATEAGRSDGGLRSLIDGLGDAAELASAGAHPALGTELAAQADVLAGLAPGSRSA